MSFLVDANVLCEATRSAPEPRVISWLTLHDASLHVSTLTLAEILKGIHLLQESRRRRLLEKWFEELRESLEGRIIPFDEAASEVWAVFYAKHERMGRKLSSIDSLIAATALAHGHVLATHNVVDFPDDVPTVDPWQ